MEWPQQQLCPNNNKNHANLMKKNHVKFVFISCTACFILEDSSATNYEIQLGLQNKINESENLQN